MAVAILKAILITIEVISSILLIGVILIQKSKSQGMGMAFGGSVGESIFGAQMGNVLTKTTVILAIIFFANTTLLAMMYTSGREAGAVAPLRQGPVEVTPVDPSELKQSEDSAEESAGGSSGTEDVVIPEDMEITAEDVETGKSDISSDNAMSEEADRDQ
ncbi:MAG: preprotein translocase subunit SecG [Verrucomicrobiota bacterium]